jgi:hypothetical protein
MVNLCGFVRKDEPNRRENRVDFDTASEHANFGESDGSLPVRFPWPDRSTPDAADPLTVRAAFIVVTLVSLALWAVISLVVFPLA